MNDHRVRDSSDHGWLVIKRDEYERMLHHGYAGPDEQRPGHVWCMTLEPEGTTLWKGVEVVDA